MNAHLLKLWDLLRSSLWFLPMCMALTVMVLAFAVVEVDRTLPDGWITSSQMGWLTYTGGAEGASLVLSTIAGSAITIAGTVFSMTLVAMSLASQQLGPRLLRNFMRDRVNQLVLGTFISTFIYCLLVLRTIRHEDDFVPHLAVTLGVLLALASLAVLIYFIHHVSISIQADAVIQRVGSELVDQIEVLCPQADAATAPGANAPALQLPPGFEAQADHAAVEADGYLQQVDVSALVALAQKEGLQLRLEHQPGQYLSAGQPLLRVYPPGRLNKALARRLLENCVTGAVRTPVQDFEFLVCQLVEIAVRALSPGINDPFTALACLDRLGSALMRLAQRDLPSPWRVDDGGQLRLVVPAFSFVETTEIALTQIRQNARSSSIVYERLLQTLVAVAAVARRPGDRAALREQAGLTVRSARAGVAHAEDRRQVEWLYAQATAQLAQMPVR